MTDLTKFLPRKEAHSALSARIPASLMAWLKTEAKRLKVSVSQVVVALIRQAKP